MQAVSRLSERDAEQRRFTLMGSVPRVVLHICGPLALYQFLLYAFKILDTFMASYIGTDSVSAVAYLTQINFMVSALGGGLALGGGIKISQAHGAGDYTLVKQRVNTLFVLCFGLCALLGVLCVFAVPFMRLCGMPEELMAAGAGYFRVSMIELMLQAFNDMYIAVERARGNAKRILYVNLLCIVVKGTMTALFVFGLSGTVTSIAVASVIAQACVFACGLYRLCAKRDAFSLSLRAISLRKDTLAPLMQVSYPVMLEKAAFSYGKIIVNSMSVFYGAVVVGAASISSRIGDISVSAQTGFQDGCSSIISQNLGANRPRRAFAAFRWTLLWCVGFAAVGFTVTMLFLPQLIGLFASGDAAFGALIARIYQYDAFSTFGLAVTAACMALFYGFGRTRLTLVLNVIRLFVLRIPFLWLLQHYTSLGCEAVGIVMAVSNAVSASLCLACAAWVIRQECRSRGIRFWQAPETDSVP